MIDGNFHRGSGVKPQTQPRRVTLSGTSIAAGVPFTRLSPSPLPIALGDNSSVTAIFNTEEVARDQAIIFNSGIQTENYLANPVIQFSHLADQPPVGRAKKLTIGRRGGVSTVEIEFVSADLYAFGAMIGDMVRAGYLNAVSMAWVHIQYRYSTDKGRENILEFLKVDLIEISIVPVPALASAVVTARSAGLDTQPFVGWADEMLSAAIPASLLRSDLEACRRAAKMPIGRSGKTISATTAGNISGARQHAQNCIDALDDLIDDEGDVAAPSASDVEDEARARRMREAEALRLRVRLEDADAQWREAGRKGPRPTTPGNYTTMEQRQAVAQFYRNRIE